RRRHHSGTGRRWADDDRHATAQHACRRAPPRRPRGPGGIMMFALLLASATLPTAIDVERAFARDAQKIGQWTAFRKYADRDAVMFTPQAVWVQEFLKDRKDPPKSVRWAPAHSFVSCDGRIAVNTGPWCGADGVHHGYFTTVWQRTNGAWRWVYDGGDAE